jgi:hypothetical protein
LRHTTPFDFSPLAPSSPYVNVSSSEAIRYRQSSTGRTILPRTDSIGGSAKVEDEAEKGALETDTTEDDAGPVLVAEMCALLPRY